MSQHYGIWGITVESYVAVAILALLSWLSGYWLRRRSAATSALLASCAVPLLWFGGFLWSMLPFKGYYLGSAATLAFELVAAIVPLAGVAIGWAISAKG